MVLGIGRMVILGIYAHSMGSSIVSIVSVARSIDSLVAQEIFGLGLFTVHHQVQRGKNLCPTFPDTIQPANHLSPVSSMEVAVTRIRKTR